MPFHWNFDRWWSNKRRQTATGIHYEKITVNRSFVHMEIYCFFVLVKSQMQTEMSNWPVAIVHMLCTQIIMNSAIFPRWHFSAYRRLIITHVQFYYYFLIMMMMMKSNKCLYLHEISCFFFDKCTDHCYILPLAWID